MTAPLLIGPGGNGQWLVKRYVGMVRFVTLNRVTVSFVHRLSSANPGSYRSLFKPPPFFEGDAPPATPVEQSLCLQL